jgi:SAM-dependent methyltransferase
VTGGIGLLQDAVERGCRDAVGSGRPEAILREAVQPVLASLLFSGGYRSAAHDEASLLVPAPADAESLDAPLASYGRADAIYNRFVIEFEPPGSLRPSLIHSATRHAVTQVKQYLRGVSDRDSLPLERLAGCAFDGNWIVYITWERGEWHETRPRSVDAEVLQALVDTLGSLATGRGLTADNLDQDFGRASDSARRLVPLLFRAAASGSGRAETMFRQWSHDLGIASGPFSTTDLADWRVICEELGVPPTPEEAAHVLFALQTYFSLVAKLVALIILEGATGHVLVKQLGAAEDVFTAFEALESGTLTHITGALNVIEPGVLSWYVHERSEAMADALLLTTALAEEYSAEIVEVTPLAVRDVLKDLYQRLLPRSIRHRLGEYYTPDWLAERVVDLVLSVPTPYHLGPETRVVDPACGSGTFLVDVVNRQVSAAPVDARERTLELILRNVVGFDVSPLAVQAAKVNYLLALAPLLKVATKPIVIPIFMADAVSPPRRGDLLEGDVFVFDSSEGPWELPAVVVDEGELMTVGAVVAAALADQSSREDVERELARVLPPPCDDNAVVERLGVLYEKIRQLHELDRNGMWWQILGNAFAPMLQGSFDIVVGNPPWVSWETLPESYRRANDAQWLAYGLRPDAPLDRRQASAQVRLDLAMLFVARSMDKLLRNGGRLGFVITATVFKSELAGRGFRRRRLPGGTYRLCHVEDLSRLAVFDHAANQTALMIAAKEDGDTFPVPVVEWSKLAGQPRSIPTSLGLDAVLRMTGRLEMRGEPVSVRDIASPMIVLPEEGLVASRDLRRASWYLQQVREGVNTRGANGVFFLEVLERRGTKVRVRNVASAGRNREVPIIERWVEERATRLLLRGEDVHREGAQPALGLLFFHDEQNVSRPMPDGVASARFPDAYAFAKEFEEILRSRRPFRGFDPTGEDWLGLYSVTQAALAEHKVVFREISQQVIAAAVHSSLVLPDHKLHVIRCTSADEADWLAEVMNSDLVDRLARAFALTTSIGGSLLRYIGIRRLSDEPLPPPGGKRLEKALGLRRRQVEMMRDALNIVNSLGEP